MRSAIALQQDAATAVDLVPVEQSRDLLAVAGRRPARATVLSLGLQGEIGVRMVAGRFVVSRQSIDAYRVRHGMR